MQKRERNKPSKAFSWTIAAVSWAVLAVAAGTAPGLPGLSFARMWETRDGSPGAGGTTAPAANLCFTPKLLVAMTLGALLAALGLWVQLKNFLEMLQWHRGHNPPALPGAGGAHGPDPTSFCGHAHRRWARFMPSPPLQFSKR